MKKLSKVIYVAVACLILVLSALFAVVFSLVGGNGGFFGFHGDTTGLVLYVVFKVLVSLALVAMVLVACLSKTHQEGVHSAVLINTFVLQLLPLVNRGIAQIPYGGSMSFWPYSLMIDALWLVGYLITVLLLLLARRKMLQTKEEVKPSEIEVTPAKSVFDEDGSFKGPRG